MALPTGATSRGTPCPPQHHLPAPRYGCIAGKLSRPLAKAEGAPASIGLDRRRNTASNTNCQRSARPEQTPMGRSQVMGCPNDTVKLPRLSMGRCDSSRRRSGRLWTRSSRAPGSCYGWHPGAPPTQCPAAPTVDRRRPSLASDTGLATCARTAVRRPVPPEAADGQSAARSGSLQLPLLFLKAGQRAAGGRPRSAQPSVQSCRLRPALCSARDSL
jgi:hypothetical protein